MEKIKVPKYYKKQIERILNLDAELHNKFTEEGGFELESGDVLSALMIREIARLREEIKVLNSVLKKIKTIKLAVPLDVENDEVTDIEDEDIIRNDIIF